MSDLVSLAHAVFAAWHALGHEQLDHPLLRCVRETRTPDVYDANFAYRLRAQDDSELDALFAQLEAVFAGYAHRHVLWDPGLSAACEARLVIEGFRLHNPMLSLVLDGALAARGPELELRVAESDTDWQRIATMRRIDHDEGVARGLHPAWPDSVIDGLVQEKRWKAPAVRYLIARQDGVDCGYFSAWPGQGGLGMVEDLFTHPEFRGRGIATALVAACVDDARARGARAVLVSPLADDTPKQLYAALGFRPLCVQRSYLRD